MFSCAEKAGAVTSHGKFTNSHPSSLEVATYAVTLLENNPLFNASRGAVFTRDGINELEASVMVSSGRAKRGVGVMGLRRVKHPILLAKRMLEEGDTDLAPGNAASTKHDDARLDVPSAQGHTQVYGQSAEQLAEIYGLELVDPSYFFTQQRWDEHVRALDRERSNPSTKATWSEDEYLPQGTVGAVALDENGVICAATSTGGMTNKLSGRVGDTPVPGAGFWAEEWTEHDDQSSLLGQGYFEKMKSMAQSCTQDIEIMGWLKGFLADCLPTPWTYTPIPPPAHFKLVATRSIGGSGTGNGDSFLRINALRTLAAMARFKPESGSAAITHIAGRGGELQKSAGDRWKKTGEGEGGIIGIENTVVRTEDGKVVDVRSEILMDYNCGGMYRGWLDDSGSIRMSIWTNGGDDDFLAPL